jgi:hypothetical protein
MSFKYAKVYSAIGQSIFNILFLGQWSVLKAYSSDPDNEVSLSSLMKTFNTFVDSGNYEGGSNEERVKEKTECLGTSRSIIWSESYNNGNV